MSTPEQPFWWDAAPPRQETPSPLPSECDVVVVGAGYTGLAAALVLARAGRSVHVLDRQRPGEGASSRNGGITSGNIRISLSGAIAQFGLDRALAIYREGVAARRDLYRFIKDEGIECDLHLSGRFTGALTMQSYEAQAREVDVLNQHLDLGAEMVPKARQHEEIGSDLYQGGLLRPDIGHLHPAKLHRGLLERARESGAVVHGETPATRIERDGAAHRVTTSRGAIKAGRVIMATNGYTDGVSRWLRRRLVPIASRIVATEPISPNLMRHMIPRNRAVGETRRLYRYYRPSPDGTRLILGGRDRQLGSDPAPGVEALRRSVVEIFPDLADVRIEQSWNGFVAFSRDELPRLFEQDGVVHACGYCGSGVVWARWLGEKAAYRVLGAPEAETAFDGPPPKAIPLYEGYPWFLPAAIAWEGLQDRMTLRNRRTG